MSSNANIGHVINVTGERTPTAAEVGAVPATRKVNNRALSADISLTASDVGAMPAIPGVVMSYDASSRTFVIQKEIGG